MVATRNLKYADSLSNYYVIMMVQDENFKFLRISENKYRVEANSNREAVVWLDTS